LALLRVVGEDLANMPPLLEIADSGDVRLGAEAVVVGFPLADVLGSDHKVTSGLISALDGIGGDPRMLQLTAPIQPGSSGSPLFDLSGRVIGLVTSTLSTIPTIRATGQAPQNVNFAVKSEYLALLLRRVPNRTLGAPQMSPASVPEMIERVRVSVGQIRTYR
jgi:S1-C subfamily serine protease